MFCRAFAECHHRAGDFEAGQIAGAGRRRIDTGTLRDIESSQEQYRDLRLQRRRLRRTYLGLLLLLTIGVLFASTWLALYLSKMVTRPLVALAEEMLAELGVQVERQP